MTQFTNDQFIAYCKQMVGQPYWYGCVGYKCTQSLYEKKSKQYPSHYTLDRYGRYMRDIKQNKVCMDCVGLIKSFWWTNGGQGVAESIGKPTMDYKVSYASNGMPDYSANELFNWARGRGAAWGTIATIPNKPGICLHAEGHVGVYIGNNEEIEARGFNYGVVQDTLEKKRWLQWFELPLVEYDGKEIIVPKTDVTIKLGDRLLYKGCSGDDVKELQKWINVILNLNLEEDGIFGKLTENGVIKLQSKIEVTVDGYYGAKTHAALMSYLADLEPIESAPTPTAEPETVKPQLVVTADTAKIYAGDSTKYGMITTVKKGDTLTPLMSNTDSPILTKTNWVAVECTNQIGWIERNSVR